MPTNRHHTLFPRVIHNATEVGATLRSRSLLIPRMDVDAHTELHQEIQLVPPLSHHMGSRVLRLMELSQATTNLQAIDDYMISVEDAMEHPKANDLDKKLGSLVVECMYSQIPFIEKGQKTRFIDLKSQKVHTSTSFY